MVWLFYIGLLFFFFFSFFLYFFTPSINLTGFCAEAEPDLFCVYGKRQAEISRLPKTREIYLVSAYILPVSHSCRASTKNREIS